MFQGLADVQPVEVQDVAGQQRWVDPLKNLNCCTVIRLTHTLAVQVSLKKQKQGKMTANTNKSIIITVNHRLQVQKHNRRNYIASKGRKFPPRSETKTIYRLRFIVKCFTTENRNLTLSVADIYLLCVKWCHFFASLLVSLCCLGETLELSAPL